MAPRSALFTPEPPEPDEATGTVYTGPSPYSGHGIDAFTHCPQYWRLRYGSDGTGLNSDSDQPALLRGTLFHVGLAHLYARRLARQVGTDPARYLPPAAAVEALAGARSPVWREHVPVILYALEHYRNYYADLDNTLTFLGVERTFHLRGLPRPHTRSEDLVYRGQDGRVYFNDHKTTGRLTDDVVEQYALDGTFLDGELIGRQTLGLPGAEW